MFLDIIYPAPCFTSRVLVDKGGLLLCCISKTIVRSDGLYQLLGPLAEHAWASSRIRMH